MVARLLGLFRGRRLDDELDGEVRAHLELAERDGIARGLSPEEARLAARRAFGGIEQMREIHRDRRGVTWLSNLVHDFLHGLRLLGRDPSFTAIATGVLALGIGANVAMFGIVDAVLLKPLPFEKPEQMVRIWEAPRPGVTNATSAPDYLDWKRLATSFDALCAEVPQAVTLMGAGEPVRIAGKGVTSDFFRVFAKRPLLGRTFDAKEDQAGADAVLVISHATWQNHFGGEPSILSKRAILDGESYQIIGVMPPGPVDVDRAEFWKPLIITRDQMLRGNHWLQVHGRLRDGISAGQARDQLRSIRAGMMEETPAFKRTWTIMTEPLSGILVGSDLQQTILVAFGAVVLVLLIACANVASLLLAKGATRSKEIAIRSALGASRGRLFVQLATESLALCLLGGAAGLAMASLLIRVAGPFLAKSLPFSQTLTLDPRLFGFAAAIALGVAMLVGALPSVQNSFGGLEQVLRQSSRGSSGANQRMRRIIVIGEIALSLVLVSGALLLLKSLSKLQNIDTGVRIENVVAMNVNLPVKLYPQPEKAAMFYEAARERLKAAPGVSQVAFTTHLPLRWIGNGERLDVQGGKEPVSVRFKRVDPGYFQEFGIPLLAGRGIELSDSHAARRVVVINEALAKRLADVAGIEDPVGQVARLHCPKYSGGGTEQQEVQIVGVIRSERVGDLGRPDPAVVYVPLAQVPHQGVFLVVKTPNDPLSAVSAIREAMREVAPGLPLGEPVTMQEVREQTMSGTTRPAWVIGVFAGIAVLLTAIGLYGVLAQMVAQRRREIGIRMALGARSRDVIGEILRNAMTLVVIGLALGMAGAYAMTRVLRTLLFQVSPLDPAVLGAACVGMACIGLLAGFVPASRASRVDPVTTLRDE